MAYFLCMALRYWSGAHTRHRIMYHLVWVPKYRKRFPEIEEFLWGDSFWADGYFAETIGALDWVTAKDYIRENKESMT